MPDSNAYTDGHVYSNPHGNADGNSNAQCYSASKSDAECQTYADAKVSPYTGTAPVTFIRLAQAETLR